MTMDFVREQLVSFLQTAQAHMTFAEAVKDFPLEKVNEFPPNVDYSPWMLLEHIRLTQKDIMDFMVNPDYSEPEWPKDYWPANDTKADKAMWEETLQDYQDDLQRIVDLVQDPKVDLSAKVEKGTGQTVIREILLIIDHTSYHIGEFSILRQIMSSWPKTHEK